MVGWHHRSTDMSLSKFQKIVKDWKLGVLQSRGGKESHSRDSATTVSVSAHQPPGDTASSPMVL